MAIKNISITDEAYGALQREKRNDESFTEIILRLTRSTGRLSDCFGSWEMTQREDRKMREELSKGWKHIRENDHRSPLTQTS